MSNGHPQPTRFVDLSPGDGRDPHLILAVQAFLETNEALNSIQLAGFQRWVDDEDDRWQMYAVLEHNRAVGFASIWPPANLILAPVTEERAIDTLVTGFLAGGVRFPGVMAEHTTAVAFSEAWTAASGSRSMPGMQQKIMQCSQVTMPTDVAGSARLATADDWEWLLPWAAAFGREAEGATGDGIEVAGRRIMKRLGPPGGMMIWTGPTGDPVSFAGFKDPTRHGWRIGPVYTPPEHRNHGYGSAVTAAATAHLLEAGAEFVCLYTDAANPTSNHIYTEIGYEVVADSTSVAFAFPDPDAG